MSAGFGWFLSDVVLLLKITEKVVRALNKDGASLEFRKATRSLISLQLVLEEIRTLIVDSEPSFRNAIRGQLDESTSSIRDFIDSIQKKYGRELNSLEPRNDARTIWKKFSWTFQATSQCETFRRHLSEQLQTVTFLMHLRML